MPKENRQYKDSVFTDLFYSDETAAENLLSLYNAIYGTDYTDPGIVEKCRLEDVIFMNFKNDVAALFGKRRLFLSEHQSTVSNNMPLRMLLYVAREYEKLTDKKKRYQRATVDIPTPEFICFYNGTAPFPEEKVLRLSDAFMEKTENPELELTVRVVNINEKEGHDLLQKCPVLLDYSRFVEIVRECEEKDPENGLKDAVEQCIREGILSTYLMRKGSEVINMLMAEYSYEEDMAANREEAREQELIETCQELGQAYDFTLKRLMTKFSLSQPDAESYMKEYWKEQPDPMQKREGNEGLLTAEYSYEEDMAANREEGREEGIKALVETCQEAGLNYDFILKSLMTKFSLSQSDADARMKLYWKE